MKMTATGSRFTRTVCNARDNADREASWSMTWASSTVTSSTVACLEANAPTWRTSPSNALVRGVASGPARNVVATGTTPRSKLSVTSFSSWRNSRPRRSQAPRASGKWLIRAANVPSPGTAWWRRTAQPSSLAALSATAWAATVLPTPLSPVHA